MNPDTRYCHLDNMRKMGISEAKKDKSKEDAIKSGSLMDYLQKPGTKALKPVVLIHFGHFDKTSTDHL